MTQDLQLGFLCAFNPLSPESFSGTPHYMYRALQRQPGVGVHLLGPHRPPRPWDRISRRLFGPQTPVWQTPRTEGLDAVVVLVSHDLLLRFGPQIDVPIYAITDATPRFLREFYKTDVSAEREAAEARGIALVHRMIYSSAYMAARARQEFGTELAGKMTDIPFGLNLDALPEHPTPKPQTPPLKLLFVGKDWDRKGGARALAMLDVLLARGVAAELTVIGCDPDAARTHPQVRVLGHLNKSRAGDYSRLKQAFAEAHLFVLPTQADCTPMVVAEANAYSCPVLITDTGGIGSLMCEGVNGRMLPPGASAEAYADAALALTADNASYEALTRSSHAHSRDRLSWQAWARDMTALIHQTI